MNYNNLHIRET